MKLLLILLFLSVVNSLAKTPTLANELTDILMAAPIEDVRVIVNKHTRNDKGFQAAIQYLRSDEWQMLEKSFETQPEVIEVFKYLMRMGVDMEMIFDFMDDYVADIKVKNFGEKPSMKKFIDELVELMSHEDLSKVLAHKLENSWRFQDFYDKLSSERFRQVVNKALAAPKTRTLLVELEEIDVPAVNAIKGWYDLMGWPPTNLALKREEDEGTEEAKPAEYKMFQYFSK